MKPDDLDKAREREYPKRCRKCFNFESICRCPKETHLQVRLGTSGVWPACRDRLAVARFN